MQSGKYAVFDEKIAFLTSLCEFSVLRQLSWKVSGLQTDILAQSDKCSAAFAALWSAAARRRFQAN